jgi:hypothetical protein
VSEDDTLDRHSVESSESFGGMIVITQGIDGTDQVLLDGFQRARQGNRVNPKEDGPLKKVPMPDDSHTTDQSEQPGKAGEGTPVDDQGSSDQRATRDPPPDSDAASDGESESKP